MGLMIHANCLLFSRGVSENEEGRVSNVGKMLKRQMDRRCGYCCKRRASIHCECLQSQHIFLHFPCVFYSNSGRFDIHHRYFCNLCLNAHLHNPTLINTYPSRKRLFINHNNLHKILHSTYRSLLLSLGAKHLLIHNQQSHFDNQSKI